MSKLTGDTIIIAKARNDLDLAMARLNDAVLGMGVGLDRGQPGLNENDIYELEAKLNAVKVARLALNKIMPNTE